MAPTEQRVRPRVAGLPVDPLTMEQLVEAVAVRIAAGGVHRVVVTNANKAWLASRQAELRGIVEQADLVVAEFATAWGARQLGIDGVAHVGGLTLMIRLLAEAPARGWSVYLLGAQSDTVQALATRLRHESPELKLAGWHHGFLDTAAETAVRRDLARVRPDLLFVAMGSPRQEQFMARLEDGMAGVVLGVGGSFDVLSGQKADAPGWMRGRGLEWLHRLAQDPARLWRRYLVTNPWFVWQVWRARWGRTS